MTPDLVYDQMVAAGVADRLIFSYLGNPGVGSLHAIRRAVEKGIPRPLAIEEYTHFGMVGRYIAGASRLPFFPLRSYRGSEMVSVNDQVRFVTSPYADGEEIAVVPPLNPDVAFVHAQRADASGNTQICLGMQKEVASPPGTWSSSSRRSDEAVIRHDPNRTVIPGLIVDAVVEEPYGAHPSYVQGYYDRDNDFYLRWEAISRDQAATEAWLQEWVYGVPDRAAYLEKLGAETIKGLAPGEMWSEPVNYGRYD